MPQNKGDVNVLFALALIVFLAATIFSLSGCSHVQEHNPLISQVLKPRLTYSGLTNQICKEAGFLGKCNKWDVINYDLNSAYVRRQLVDFGFRCSIAKRRFKICEDVAGFCRYEAVRDCFLCEKKVKVVESVPIEQTEYLINSGAICWSQVEYPDGF